MKMETGNGFERLDSQKKSKKLLVIFGVLFVLAISILSLLYIKGNYHGNTKETGSIDEQVASVTCPEGWKFYKQDVVGVSFCYPKQWGDVGTDPAGLITRLNNLSMDGYEEGDDAHNDHFTLIFNNGSEPSAFPFGNGVMMTFFNDKYDRNAVSEVNDSIAQMKSSGSVCGYKGDSAFYIGHYTSCENNILTSVWEHNNADPNTFLYSFAYKKINNGYFDNILIQYAEGNKEIQFAVDPKLQYKSINEALSQLGKSKEDYDKERKDFEIFLNSIKAFKPVESQKESFEEIKGEDSRITSIRKYFWLLSDGRIEDAYNMMQPNETYAVFAEQNKNIYKIKAYDFKKVGDDEFEFYVDRENHNSPVAKYDMGMRVVDGKLISTLLEKFIEEETSSQGYKAYSVLQGESLVLRVKKGDEKITVDQINLGEDVLGYRFYDTRSYSPSVYFNKYKFSADGKYLSYVISTDSTDRERGLFAVRVYDIENKKPVLTRDLGDYTITFDFTPDVKHFYVCTEPDYLQGLAGEVYSVPGFSKEFDALAGENKPYQNVKCKYDQNEKVVIFTLSNPTESGLPNEKEIKYSVK